MSDGMLAAVLIAAGPNTALRYKLEGSTLIIWIGGMYDAAPDDAITGVICDGGNAFQITVTDDDPLAFPMPERPEMLQ